MPPAICDTPHATCCLPNAANHTLPASHLPVPGFCNSASLLIEHAGAYMGAYSQERLGVSSILRVYLQATQRCTWVRTRRCSWEWLESLLRSIKSSRLGVCHRVRLGACERACPGLYFRTYSEEYLGVYLEFTWERPESVSQAGWKCTVECNQECTSECT